MNYTVKTNDHSLGSVNEFSEQKRRGEVDESFEGSGSLVVSSADPAKDFQVAEGKRFYIGKED